MAKRIRKKTQLTPREMITAAYMHYVRCIDQDSISVFFNINIGRINEACKKIGHVVGLTTPSYKDNHDDHKI